MPLPGTNAANGYESDWVWVIMKRVGENDSIAMVHTTKGKALDSMMGLAQGGMVVWLEKQPLYN